MIMRTLKEANAHTPAVSSDTHTTVAAVRSSKLREVINVAQVKGLFSGRRTKMLRGRMPQALVKKAKQRTGIDSDTVLIEVALAYLAVADECTDWLLKQRGTISQDVDLEF
jgi:hypothetical protein